MTKRMNIASGTAWEEEVGYSRAVRIGHTIEVAGTTATDGDEIIGRGDLYAQAKHALQKIEHALQQAGASLQDVIRTRIFVTDISRWQEVARAHGEVFRHIKPVTTLVQVQALIHPDLLVEIEASAITGT
ncbi:RidA family protein [Pontibacter chitinilyticus]|uniref:RidA family protein n=1 Tax=Pontibacter chitinilyticus TaxID=2674989 RepID=UPI0032193622